MSARKPARWATYPGDCRGNIGRVVGPRHPISNPPEYMHIVTEEYDAATDKTRVGFAFGLPESSS